MSFHQCMYCLVLAAVCTASAYYPPDAGLIDVTKSPYNAKNDGTGDQASVIRTAWQDARDKGGVLYFPRGTYRVASPLYMPKHPRSGASVKELRAYSNQNVLGEDRETTIIKLADGAYGKRNLPVMDFLPGQQWSNNSQMNALEGLTVDIGSGNPGAIGIIFHGNNGTAIRDVAIVSSDPRKRGFIGLDLSKGTNGPGLVASVTVVGFDIGIRAGNQKKGNVGRHAYTVLDPVLREQRNVGIEAAFLPLQLLRMRSVLSVPAIRATKDAQVLLIDSRLEGTATSAIENQGGYLFVRHCRITGAINDRSKKVPGGTVNEYSTHGAVTAFDSSPKRSLDLPVPKTPEVAVDAPDQWANVVDFGAKPGDNGDDAPGIQKAINSGKTTVYFPHGTYTIGKTIEVGGAVRRLEMLYSKFRDGPGLGTRPLFRIVKGSASVVVIQKWNNQAWAHQGRGRTTRKWMGSAVTIEQAARTLVIKDAFLAACRSYRNTAPGTKFFAENVASYSRESVTAFEITRGGMFWGFNLNPEDEGKILVNGGFASIWGGKDEGGKVKLEARNGALVESMGWSYLNNSGSSSAPLVVNNESHVTFFCSNFARDGAFRVIAEERRNGKTARVGYRTFPQRSVHIKGTICHFYTGFNEGQAAAALKKLNLENVSSGAVGIAPPGGVDDALRRPWHHRGLIAPHTANSFFCNGRLLRYGGIPAVMPHLRWPKYAKKQ